MWYMLILFPDGAIMTWDRYQDHDVAVREANVNNHWVGMTGRYFVVHRDELPLFGIQEREHDAAEHQQSGC